MFTLVMKTDAQNNEFEEIELEKLITAASERVWNVFYTHKKEVSMYLFIDLFLLCIFPPERT